MWLEAEFGDWHLYETFPLRECRLLVFALASLSFFFLSALSVPFSLCLSLSACVSLFLYSRIFSLPAPLWPWFGLPVLVGTAYGAPAVAVQLAYSGLPGTRL